jgi:hypothetical protein
MREARNDAPADQCDQQDDRAYCSPHCIIGDTGKVRFEVEADIRNSKNADDGDDLEVSPVTASRDFARRRSRNQHQECGVDDRGRRPADPRRGRYRNASRKPHAHQHQKRCALEWQPAGPVRDGGQ